MIEARQDLITLYKIEEDEITSYAHSLKAITDEDLGHLLYQLEIVKEQLIKYYKEDSVSLERDK